MHYKRAFKILLLTVIIFAFSINLNPISYAQEESPKDPDQYSSYRPGMVSAGLYHTLLVNEAGQVYSWGDNSCGQLGIGVLMNEETPMLVDGITDVVKVSAGDYHSLALTASGDVYAWGRNSFGQIGNGDTSTSTVPVRVENIPPMVDISAGGLHSLALGIDGFVYAWGMNTDGQIGKVESETIYDNSESVLGMRVKSPQKIAGPGIKAVSAGGMHSLYLDEKGRVFAWGNNEYGQLGDGTNISRSDPMQVQNLENVIDISGGYFYNLALCELSENDSKTISTNLYSWGSNSSGQLGLGIDIDEKSIVNIPTKVDITGDLKEQNDNISLISAGYLSSVITVFVSPESTKEHIYVWGNNDYTQLGIGKMPSQSKPVRLIASSDGWTGDEFLAFSSVSAGGYHAALLSVKGFVGITGRGDKAQLGNVSAINSDKFIGVKVRDAISPEWIEGNGIVGEIKGKDLLLSWDEASDNVGVVGYKVNYTIGEDEPKTVELGNETEYILKNFILSPEQIITVVAVDAENNTSENPLEYKENSSLEKNQISEEKNPLIYGEIIPLEVPWDTRYIYGENSLLPPKDNSLVIASAITISFVLLFLVVGLSSFKRTHKGNKVNSHIDNEKSKDIEEKKIIKVGDSVSIISDEDED